MRREEVYLTDIVEAAESINKFLAGIKRQTFLQDDLLRSAVLQKLSIIGEAASRLASEFRNCHAEIEWADIIGFRNIAIHAYFAVDWSIVWFTATKEVPDLSKKAGDILAKEYSDSTP